MGNITEFERANGRIYFGSPAAVVGPVQEALLREGASLQVDGDFGPISETAVKRFQASHNIAPVGYVGKHTAPLLDKVLEEDDGPLPPAPGPSVLRQAPWLARMRALTGTRELPGSPDSPIILSWNKDIKRAFPQFDGYPDNYTHDAIAWCGQCMAEVMVTCDPPIQPPYNAHDDLESYLYANSWAHFGDALSKPIVGCVMVFKRTGGGHVSLLEKIEGSKIWIRGGNQSDMINVTTRDLDDGSFVAARWPHGWPQVPIIGDIVHTMEPGSEA